MQLGNLFETKAGGDYIETRSSDVQDNRYTYPIYANGLEQQGLYGFSNYADEQAGSITVTARGTLGKAFYRDQPFVAIGRLLVLKPKVAVDARFFSEYINYGVRFAVESTGVPQLTAPQVARYSLPVPPFSEQRAIAAVLSDVDGLIGALDALIAKKRSNQAGNHAATPHRRNAPAWVQRSVGNETSCRRCHLPRQCSYTLKRDRESQYVRAFSILRSQWCP